MSKNQVCIELPVHVPKGDFIFKAEIKKTEDFTWVMSSQSLMNELDYKKSILNFNQQVIAVVSLVVFLIFWKITRKKYE